MPSRDKMLERAKKSATKKSSSSKKSSTKASGSGGGSSWTSAIGSFLKLIGGGGGGGSSWGDESVKSKKANKSIEKTKKSKTKKKTRSSMPFMGQQIIRKKGEEEKKNRKKAVKAAKRKIDKARNALKNQTTKKKQDAEAKKKAAAAAKAAKRNANKNKNKKNNNGTSTKPTKVTTVKPKTTTTTVKPKTTTTQKPTTTAQQPTTQQPRSDSLMDRARMLTETAFSPNFATIDAARIANENTYRGHGDQRIQELNRALGSIQGAGQVTDKTLGQYQQETDQSYQQAQQFAQQQQQVSAQQRNTTNSNMLSNLQAELQARGLNAHSQDAMVREAQTNQSSLMDAINASGNSAMAMQRQNAGDLMTTLRSQATMQTAGDTERAKAAGRSDLQGMYNQYQQQRLGLDSQEAQAVAEQGKYFTNTYMTLEDQQRQAQAEQAALEMEYAYKGAVLSETQRHNMASEAGNLSRTNLDAAKLQADQSYKQALLKLQRGELSLKQEEALLKAQQQANSYLNGGSSGSTKTATKGYNAANQYALDAISSTGLFSGDVSARLAAAIKNFEPEMGNSGQRYARASTDWYNLLNGGGERGDLDRYLTTIVAQGGVPQNQLAVAKNVLSNILKQYSLIAGGKA